MARIILNWLNEEVRLSKEILNIAEDFSNGFLLGELLGAYNQQHHLDQFIDKDTPDAKIRNFCLLEPTMRQVGVHFNSKVAFDVMNHKPGAMKTLLYELKTVLDSVKEMSMAPDGTQKCNIMQIIRPSKPFYDKTMASTFENAIRAMVENPNDVLYQKTQNTYDAMSVTFKDSVSSAHSLQLDDIAIEIQRNKELTRQRKRHEKEFQETWHEINMEQWRTNQIVARDRRNLQTVVDARISNRKTQMKKQENINAREKAISNIDEFEERLQSMRRKEDPADKTLSIDIRTAGGEEGTGVPMLSYMNDETLRDGMVKNSKIMKERNEKLRLRRQEHDKRRKRFVRLRESHHSSMLYAEADKEIVEQVLVTSQIEDVEKFAKLRFGAYGSMMEQNEKNLGHVKAMLSSKAAEDVEKCKAQDTLLEKDLVISHHKRAQASRLNVAEEAKVSALRVDIEEIAQRELNRILDITDWIVNMRAHGAYAEGLDVNLPEEKILPDILLRDVSTMYTSEILEIPEALPVMHPTNVFDHFPQSLSWRPLSTETKWLFEDAFRAAKYMTDHGGNSGDNVIDSNMAKYLNLGDCNQFIQNISSYEAKAVEETEDSGKKDKKKDAKKEKDPKKGKKGKKGKEEEVIPESGVKIISPSWIGETSPDCLLGETVVSVRCIAEPIPEPPQVPECIPTQQTRLILCGSSAFMKKKVAESLSKELELELLNVNDLLAKAMTTGCDLVTNVSDVDENDAYSAVVMSIYNKALNGDAVADEDYVQLLVHAITRLEANGKGFVIEDFPNTDEQAFKLVTAVSGIDYNEHRPQPKDKVSPFLTTIEREEVLFDHKQCGFDRIFFLASQPLSIVENRVTLRDDHLTNEVASITDQTEKVDTLAEIVTPTDPMDTLSFLLSNSAQAIEPIRVFAHRLGVASAIVVDDDKDVTSAVSKILEDLNPPVEQVEETEKEKEEEKAKEEIVEQDENKNDEATNDKVEESAVEEQTDENKYPPLVLQEGRLAPSLAKVLNQLWSTGEKQVSETCVQFFSGMRDSQYQMVQRRGGIRHAVMCSILRRDDKQDIFDAFREQFNSFEMDFRFDADLINELYLRTLELRNQFWTISEERAAGTNDIIDDISRDSSVNVLVHNCECEGAQLLQDYATLFVNGINMLLDHMRAVSTYDAKKNVDQTLQEVDPVPEDFLGENGQIDESGGKGKGDKDKGKGKGPTVTARTAVACPVLWSEMESSIPQPVPKVEEEPDNGKKKPAGKEKKDASAEVIVSPFAMSKDKATSFCQGFNREAFALDREIYGEDDVLADAIEKSIWHEADRFLHMIEMVSSLVASQSGWLVDQESEVVQLMKKMVEKRKITELATTERLCEMIYQCIEDNVPIRTQWQVAPDVIVVREERLVYPPAVITETVEMNNFFSSQLNEEQSTLAKEMLHQLQLGNDSILKEDLMEWLHQCSSGIGPVACNTSPTSNFYNLSFPKLWQEKSEGILDRVYSSTAVCGTSEETGTTSVNDVMEKLSSLGNEPPS